MNSTCNFFPRVAILLCIHLHVFSIDLFYITPAKSGTLMLSRCLRLILSHQSPEYKEEFTIDSVHLHQALIDRSERFVSNMWKKSPSPHIILHLRDPRDILLSYANFIYRHKGWHPWQERSNPLTLPLKESLEPIWESLPYETKLAAFIEGSWPQPISSYRNDIKLLSHFVEIFNSDSFKNKKVLFTRFENLVGPRGGGSKELQRKEIQKITEFINASLDEKQLDQVADELYGKTMTFDNGIGGQIGKWREKFTDEIKLLFKRNYQKDLQRLGYVKNARW